MPLIIIKTLQQTTFTISVSETATVLEMKQEIMKENGSQVGSQKLIHSGKVLDDGKLVSEYGIKEKDFVVLMVTKAVVKPPAAVPVVQPTPIVQPTPVAQPTPTAQPTDTTTSLATGASYDSAVANLTEMGFEVEQIKAAMRAAFNNPDRAAEYLMTVFLINKRESLILFLNNLLHQLLLKLLKP